MKKIDKENQKIGKRKQKIYANKKLKEDFPNKNNNKILKI